MFKRLWSKIIRHKTPLIWTIIKLDDDTPLEQADDEASIASLLNHPGYIALRNKMRRRRSVVEAQLLNVRQKELRDVDTLQSGLIWLRYLELSVDQAVGSQRTRTSRVAVEEVNDFETVRSLIEDI